MNWRLLLHDAATGAWNMAVDEAMLRTHAAGEVAPTVRFYDWQPACLSLGRFQEYSRPKIEPDFDIVRRPTGGRAVWHHHEITYSAVIREELLPAGATSVVGAYRWLSEGLVMGLKELGIEAALAKQKRKAQSTQIQSTLHENNQHQSTQTIKTDPKPDKNANCFTSAAQCDFLVEGRKLIGAAQSRKQGAILQHGSILIDIDETTWNRVLGGSMQSSVSLRALGIQNSRDEIIAALVRGLEATFRVPLVSKPLTPAEIEMANRLHLGKYSQDAWNYDAIEPRG